MLFENSSIMSMHQQTVYLFQTEEGSYLNIERENNDLIILTLCMLGFFYAINVVC